MKDIEQIEPQPARGKLVESLWSDPNWIAEEKYDGFRMIAQVCNGIVRFTTRRISVKTGQYQERTPQLPHLSGLPLDRAETRCGTRPPRSLEGTILDGEIIPANYEECLKNGGVSKVVGSIVNSLPEEAVRKQIERGWLKYVVFDCLRYKGQNLRGWSWDRRRHMADAAVQQWANPFVSLSRVVGAGRKRKFYTEIIKRGGEGVILKDVRQIYGDKSSWVKVKKCATADVVIIGYKMAKEETKKKDGTISRSRIAGKVGSVEIGQWKRCGDRGSFLTSVGFARGFSDALMEKFTADPDKYIGKVITIEANDREPTGKFRHPRVVDADDPFRTDKRAKDCVFDLNER